MKAMRPLPEIPLGDRQFLTTRCKTITRISGTINMVSRKRVITEIPMNVATTLVTRKIVKKEVVGSEIGNTDLARKGDNGLTVTAHLEVQELTPMTSQKGSIRS